MRAELLRTPRLLVVAVLLALGLAMSASVLRVIAMRPPAAAPTPAGESPAATQVPTLLLANGGTPEAPHRTAVVTLVTATAEPVAESRQAEARPSPSAAPVAQPPDAAVTRESAIPAPATAHAPAEASWFEFGRSVQGRPIRAMQLGSGHVGLVLMGSIHGGWERNTERLVLTAYEHFLAHRNEVPPQLNLYFVPTTNPDGLAAGSDREAAWNARGVDLNRNFDTPNWSPDSYGRPGVGTARAVAEGTRAAQHPSLSPRRRPSETSFWAMHRAWLCPTIAALSRYLPRMVAAALPSRWLRK